MNEETKKLTWKYFWQRKTKEVLSFIVISLLIIFIPFLIGNLMLSYFGKEIICYIVVGEMANCKFTSLISIWALGFFSMLALAIVLLFLFWLCDKWITSNWKKARDRAEEEIKKDKKNGRTRKKPL